MFFLHAHMSVFCKSSVKKKHVEWFLNHPLSVRFIFSQSLTHETVLLSWAVDFLSCFIIKSNKMWAEGIFIFYFYFLAMLSAWCQPVCGYDTVIQGDLAPQAIGSISMVVLCLWWPQNDLQIFRWSPDLLSCVIVSSDFNACNIFGLWPNPRTTNDIPINPSH